ncbi:MULTISPECIES: hypothetical protein [Microvirga]|uniref:hypothetical protein n=1 Tax=Microvirga TaxID=186650 RepID=UPI0021C8950E|nr:MULTISPECIES: hypothetical protein [unclassified Microvirga]
MQVDWQVSGEQGDGLLIIDGCELGGPSLPAQPSPGFGSRLLRQAITHELGGELAARFEPEGVCCTMTIPIESAGRRRQAGGASA